jgi:hypothetical protein
MIKLDQLGRGKVYRLKSRNLAYGVWNGTNSFIGIRTKFGSRFLDEEIHWDLDENHGTALALEELGAIPESILLDISLGTECERCHKGMHYIEHRPLDCAPHNGEWRHGDGSPRCVISVENGKARHATPVMIPNKTLFAELEKYERG